LAVTVALRLSAVGRGVSEGKSVGISDGAGVSVKEEVGVTEAVSVGTRAVEDNAGGRGVSVDTLVPEGAVKLQAREIAINNRKKTRRRGIGGICAPFQRLHLNSVEVKDFMMKYPRFRTGIVK
jgi:hypothetical protein